MTKRRRVMIGMAVILMLATGACGGSPKEAEMPAGGGEVEGGGGGEAELIPEEKWEEIRATFARKTATVSRCHAEGTEAGDGEKSGKGHITVGLTILPDGSATNVRVMETSFSSKKIGECVVRMVSGWTFTTLPKQVETSHTYVLDRL